MYLIRIKNLSIFINKRRKTKNGASDMSLDEFDKLKYKRV